MARLNPDQLHVKWLDETTSTGPVSPRHYTLTHSDSTGDLFLTIGKSYDLAQIAGWYTRLMRDEVLAEWQYCEGQWFLLVHCHVSGGLVFGSAAWRYQIFQRELPLVLEAFRYGDHQLFLTHPELDQASAKVKFNAVQPVYQRVEEWGYLRDYSLS